MKQGRTPEEMLTELKRQSREKRDYIVPSQSMVMSDNGQEIIVEGKGADSYDNHYGMTDLFHRQVGTTLKIPAPYYDLMRSQKPELLAENVNSWLSGRDNNFMLRTMDYGSGRVARALLSERYRRIDNLEIAAALLPPVMNEKGFEIVSSEITPARMYIKLVCHLKTYEVLPGDFVEFGIIISNSEVGQGSVFVRPFLNRLICTNGCVINELGERKHHVGRAAKSVEDSFEIYSDSTIEAEDRVFLMKLLDVEKAALDESRYRLIIDKLKDAADAKITGRVQDVVELTAKNYGFTQTEQEGILDALICGGDMSLYGLSNAVTRFSQDVESYDRATELESAGWDIATMPAGLWKTINA